MKRLLTLLLLVLLVPAARAFPGLTLAVSPATVTNDFIGQISLNVSNLPTGHSIRVERFLDANGNGVIDTGEASFQTFIVTNGQLPLIGGVRNLNVPGDEDLASNTTIQTKVPYPDLSGTLDEIAAKWLYRVTDLANGSIATIAFITLQKTNAQGVTGKVIAAGTGLPITNCPIVLINPNANGGVGAVTDTNGNYTLYCAPGQYVVLPVAFGVISDQTLGVTVVSNTFTTNNLTNAFADRTISGSVTDSQTFTGIAGVFIQLQTSAGLFAAAFTDTNGNYTAQVNSGQWKVNINGDGGAVQGYVNQTSKITANATTGSVTGINFQLTRATALIYGNIKDNLSNSIPGIRMDANDGTGNKNVVGYSDASGNYSIATLAGTFDIGPDVNAFLGLPYVTTSSTNATIAAGQALAFNFTVKQVTAHLRGFVRYANGSAVSNIGMAVSPDYDTDGSQSLYPNANPDGSFDVGVFAGNWRVALEVSSASDAGIVGPSLNVTVTSGVDQNNIILVVYSTSTNQISGHVADINNVAVMDLHTFAGLSINGTNYSVGGTTDSAGNYVMNVFPGTWDVGLSGDVVDRGYIQPPDQQVVITGSNNGTANFTVHTLGNAGPTLLNPARIGNQFQFQVGGTTNQSYRVEATTNLTVWIPLMTNVGNFFFADTNAHSFNSRFYRVREWP